MTDVFISYSRADKERVAQLASAIEAEGYDVWWDEELPPHMSYGDVITDKIENAKAAVVVWSADASKSEWVRAEADAARNHKKLIQTALADIIPPLPFNQIQCADLSDWQGEEDHPGWRKVKQSLVALCGAREANIAAEPVVAAPPPPPPPPPPEPEAVVAPPASPPPAEDKAKSKKGALIGGGIIAGLVLVPALFMVASSGDEGGSDSQPALTTYDIEEPAGEDPLPLIGSEDSVPPVATQAAPAQQAGPATDDFNRDVVLINQSGEVVMYMYWSNTDQENWGPDQLGDDVWPDGQSANVTIDDGSGACQFDFMAVTASGREIVRPDVNVCSVYEIHFN